jgi:uncharacterized protein YkwD
MRSLSLLALTLPALLVACKTTPEAAAPPPPSPFPAWVGAVEAIPDPVLEEAARQLCAREQSVIGDALRRELGLIDGQLATLTEATGAELAALLKTHRATHLGAVSHQGCRAAVLSRRLLALQGEVPVEVQNPRAVELQVALLEGERATLFVARPDGAVTRTALSPADGALRLPLDLDREGRFRAEVLVDVPGEGPVVAALWPIEVGVPKGLPPAPEVLFPDEGHSDLALTFRLSALVHRLRTEQEIYPLKTAPLLDKLAASRAAAIGDNGALGHLVPDEKSAHDALQAENPAWRVARLSELQSQASTLQEAWGALLTSPAHRYELAWPESTHVGAAVSQGKDPAGRKLVSVVLLIARKVSETPVKAAAANLVAKFNLARDQVGRGPLRVDPALSRVAQLQADEMAKRGTTDDGLLGSPVAEIALDDEASLEVVRSVLAAVDDPMRLPASKATLARESTRVGVGLVSGQQAGRWYICVLAGR